MAIPRRLRGFAKVPVVSRDHGTVLGYCQVGKYSRAIGQPYKKILIMDLGGRVIACIHVYRLHSRVQCGDLEECVAPIDSSRAFVIAQEALEASPGGDMAVLAVISRMATEDLN